jgi:hypothetical protein
VGVLPGRLFINACIEADTLSVNDKYWSNINAKIAYKLSSKMDGNGASEAGVTSVLFEVQLRCSQ